jgi:acyl-CoA thioester hydrolase
MSRFHEQVMGVYFDDLDPYHILHNARYLLLFERTLGSFWMELGMGSFQDPDYPDRFHFVRTNYIEYLSPVRGVGKVRVRVWVERIGRTSLTFAFRMMPLDEDREHARGSRTVVRIDPDTFEPGPWSDTFRRLIQPWVAEQDPSD